DSRRPVQAGGCGLSPVPGVGRRAVARERADHPARSHHAHPLVAVIRDIDAAGRVHAQAHGVIEAGGRALSPENAGEPSPANVLITPPGLTLRTRWLLRSAI